jgi:hypothetical protein
MRFRRRSSSYRSSSRPRRPRRRAVTSDPNERSDLWEEIRRFNDADSGWGNKTAWEKFLIIQLLAKGVWFLTLYVCAVGLALLGGYFLVLRWGEDLRDLFTGT